MIDLHKRIYKICEPHSVLSVHSPFNSNDKHYFVPGLSLDVCSVWWDDTERNKHAGSDNIHIQIAGIVVSGLVDIDYCFGMNSFSV